MIDFRKFPDETDDAAASIPEILRNSLLAYGLDYRPVGGFLTALLSNDLTGAVCRADPQSLAALRPLVQYVYNVMPSACHGSKEKVKAWIEEGEIRETRKTLTAIASIADQAYNRES